MPNEGLIRWGNRRGAGATEIFICTSPNRGRQADLAAQNDGSGTPKMEVGSSHPDLDGPEVRIVMRLPGPQTTTGIAAAGEGMATVGTSCEKGARTRREYLCSAAAGNIAGARLPRCWTAGSLRSSPRRTWTERGSSTAMYSVFASSNRARSRACSPH